MDGVTVREFEINLAALSRGDDLAIVPKPDRMMFKARQPPKIDHPHFEFSKSTNTSSSSGSTFTARSVSSSPIKQPSLHLNEARSVYLPARCIPGLKKAALGDGAMKSCTTFQVVAAKIWKARSLAIGLRDEDISMMLFPVDIRKRVVPEVPEGFAGNALIPGFARASVRELKEAEDSWIVRKVQEGVERLDDEYVRSGIDWLEVNGGAPSCGDNSFSVVAWWKLGLEEAEFAWGHAKCATTISVKPGLVIVLPGGPEGQGGLCICQQLPEDQMKEFHRLMME